MTAAHATVDGSRERLRLLEDIAGQLLQRARAAGASQAEVACSEDRGLNVNVRMGDVETVEATHDRGVSVTVYFGQRKGSASTADLRESSLEATVAQAVAIARHTEEDAAAGLADAERMADGSGDFDGWHPWDIDADAAIDLALACEQAGRDFDPRVENADGTQVATGRSLGVYANSHGFLGSERHTRHSISCALIAGRGADMQRDGWYSLALEAGALEPAQQVGRKAAERTLARLSPRSVATGPLPVLFSADVARSLIGHFLSAISGGALYRRASFLLDSVGQPLFPPWMRIDELPHLMRGLRSAAFDAEGVATREAPLVVDGILQRYVLGSYSARKLGLASTGNAGGVHNLQVAGNGIDQSGLLLELGDGLLVTELMGQGVNPVTGDYSRGAAGFLVEGGRISHPVDGITIAGNLRRMFSGIRAIGDDVDPRSHIACGSILVDGMTVAGE
ncbi:MAG: metalloprotease PmbA [Pseudoxanthomonas suwonensis]|nr:metalloprotease PmbA [Pseudoxanthomonas suwonensis]